MNCNMLWMSIFSPKIMSINIWESIKLKKNIFIFLKLISDIQLRIWDLLGIKVAPFEVVL